jgi:outer membrane immunogenic protein
VKKILFAAAIAVSSAALASMPAHAADLAYKSAPMMQAAYNWTGWYVGLNAGGAWGRNDVSSVFFDGDADAQARTVGALAGSGSAKGSSAIGGVQAGYNWQGSTPWVVGLEADIQGMSLKENRTSAIFTVQGLNAQDFDQIQHNWLATFRGRAGYAVDRALFYVTGGLAVGDTRFSRTQTWDSDGCPIDPRNGFQDCHVGAVTKTSAGAVVGAGVEYAFLSNWSAKLEYLHVWLPSSASFLTQNIGVAPDVQRFNQSVNDSSLDIVRVGLNYRFGTPVVAKY